MWCIHSHQGAADMLNACSNSIPGSSQGHPACDGPDPTLSGFPPHIASLHSGCSVQQPAEHPKTLTEDVSAFLPLLISSLYGNILLSSRHFLFFFFFKNEMENT